VSIKVNHQECGHIEGLLAATPGKQLFGLNPTFNR
jgi:hypothetical protein